MAKIDWLYHRRGCRTCQRAQDYLDRTGVQAVQVVDARKDSISRSGALKLAGEVDQIFASKGTRLVHLDLGRERPSRKDLEAILIGPSGNLRAPAWRKGRTLVVGFHEDAYRQVLG